MFNLASLLFVLLTLSSHAAFAEQNNVQSDVSLSIKGGLSAFFEGEVVSCACELGSCGKSEVEINFGRVKLRPAYESERQDIRNLSQDPDVVRNYSLALQSSEEETSWLTDRLFRGPRHANLTDWGPARALSFVIADALTGKMVGVGNIRRSNETKQWEIGYAIGKEFRRNGYASQTVEGLIRFIRRTSRHGHIQATPLETNLSSQALLRKMGFQQEAAPDFEQNETGVKQTYFVLRF